MKTIVCTRYGPPEVLQLAELPKPVPRANEVLIRIVDTTCHYGDVRVRGAILPGWMQLPFRLFMGIRGPRQPVLGMELSGVVEATGAAVRRFRPGDAVLAMAGFKLGAYAEYICLPEDAANVSKGLIVHKPACMSFAEAAAGLSTGGMTALAMLRKADIAPGQSVLVYGASGSVGLYAVQLARHFGAEVTAVCSARNFALVQEFGASRVLDYTAGDLHICNETFDVIVDAVGKLSPALTAKLSRPQCTRLHVARHAGPVKKVTTPELEFLASLVEQGKLRTFIDREYPLEQIAEAHAYVQQERKRGHVVIHVQPA